MEINGGILVFGAEDGLQTFAAEVPGLGLPLFVKTAQDQNTGRWP